MADAGWSPLAEPYAKPRPNPPLRPGPIFGLCIHTTGRGVTEKAAKTGRDPIDVAIAAYMAKVIRDGKEVHHGPAYVVGLDGRVVQIASELARTEHVGGLRREEYLSGRWLNAPFPEAIRQWKLAWPGRKSPAHLYPGPSANSAYCLDPSTRVLCADLHWRAIGMLAVGDEIVGFDETLGHQNKLRHATIQGTRFVQRPCYRLHTTHGEVICSDEHLWPTLRHHGSKKTHNYTRRATWVPTHRLVAGDRLFMLVEPWSDLSCTWRGAYLAGAYDGEANITPGNVYFAQNPGLVLDRVLHLLLELGFTPGSIEFGTGRCHRVRLSGNRAALRFLGAVRPVRLLAGSRKMWEGARVFGKLTPKPRIVASEPIGQRWVCATQTSTRTLIAEGFLTHNCGLEMTPCGSGLGHPAAPGQLFTDAQYAAVTAIAVDFGHRQKIPEGWWDTPRLAGHEDLGLLDRCDAKGGWDPGFLRAKPYFDMHALRTMIAAHW
jgi:hypothetical protein